MKRKKLELLVLFWVVLLADCLLIYLENESLRIITKSALIPVLLAYFIQNTISRKHKTSKFLVSGALLMAWIGDIILHLQDRSGSYFLVGLLMFMVMHIIYTIYFLRAVNLNPNAEKFILLIALAAVVAIDVFLFYKLDPYWHELKFPILAYMAVISFMFICAANVATNKRMSSIGLQYFLPGAIFFIFSDALLGYNKFILQEAFLGIAVMLTYGYAQQLFVNGFIKHLKGI